ncbi:MAG: 3-hydroxyacyl-ACP dehydratase FabZ, partial [Candidatus Omnitrophica bacterium]|nr:3-hydroxyacyl-ACP dehydratase FabZ [Candidatus Omnitrophota bacterium]
VINNQLRFPDECARHKVLDFVGDLYLLGKPIRGRVFAVRSGHFLNLELVKKIQHQQSMTAQIKNFNKMQEGPISIPLKIEEIMKILPHRYPFLLIDRVIELDHGKRIVGIKNVTINDNFFQGHFPARPLMPGVLMVEALAQAGGILVLTNGEHHGKVALFMAVDKVKFRKVVVPGDQLTLEVELLRDRPKSSMLRGEAKVNGEVAVEVEMLFSYQDASYLIN